MYPNPVSRERGTALVFALVMLLLLTLLGITAVTTSSLQEKMAGNMRDQYMAQQAGDSIMFDGQAWISGMTDKPTPFCPPATGPNGYIWDSNCLPAAVPGATGANWWLPVTVNANDVWWQTNGIDSGSSVDYVLQKPRYVVEMIQKVSPDAEIGKLRVDTYYFRTTGWSVGASDYARGLFQSVFTRRSDTFTN